MKKIITCLALFFSILNFSQNPFEKGSIVDSIPLGNIERETFALYLPSSFNNEMLSPIVFIFEPAARGRLGIKPFIKASEKYGFIIVCSNNSKNGPYKQNFNISNNLFSHIFSIFKIKEDEMYLTGFSGGSRLACAIGSLTNQFAGVIACGAGFPQVIEYIPSSQKYAYVGLCGNRDFNYSEMIQNKTYLDELNFNNTLITSKDEHSWPDENEILKAFDWLYLQKLKKDDLQSNQKQVLKLFERDYNTITKHQNNNELIFAAENYERLIESYSHFFKLDSIEMKFKELNESKRYKQQIKSLSKAFKIETKLSNKLLTKLDLDLKNPSDNNLNWWLKQLTRLKEMEDSGDTEIKNMVVRVKFNIFATIYSSKKLYLQDTNKLQQDFIEKLLKLFQP